MDDLQELKKYPDHVPERGEEEFRQLRDRIVAELRDAPRSRHRSWPRPPRQVWIPALAGLLTVGLVLGFAGLRDTAGSPDPAEPQQGTFLQEAADHLEAEASDPMTIPSPDQWRYRKVANQGWDVYGEPEPVEEKEHWLRVDYQLAAQYNDDGELDTYAGEDAGVSETALFTDLADLYTFLGDLPDDDAAAVLDQFYAIVDEHGLVVRIMASETEREAAAKEPWSRHGAAFDLIRDVLFLASPPPDVQAKLFRALDEIPGTYEEGTTKDFTGTDVVVIAWKPPFENRTNFSWTQTVQIHLDANSYTYRGHRGVDFEAQTEANPDGIDLAVAVLEYGIVNQPGQLPQ